MPEAKSGNTVTVHDTRILHDGTQFDSSRGRESLELIEGTVLHAQGPEVQTLSFTIVYFDDQKVKVDGNHPLAGKDLTVELALMGVA